MTKCDAVSSSISPLPFTGGTEWTSLSGLQLFQRSAHSYLLALLTL
jgi:hypothetical protein